MIDAFALAALDSRLSGFGICQQNNRPELFDARRCIEDQEFQPLTTSADRKYSERQL
jgi:hypothetical protein